MCERLAVRAESDLVMSVEGICLMVSNAFLLICHLSQVQWALLSYQPYTGMQWQEIVLPQGPSEA